MAETAAQHIEIRKNRDGQPRAYVCATRIRVQDIYVLTQLQGRSPDEIASAFPHLSLAQIHAAMSYCFDNIDAIREELRQDEDFVSRMRARTGPGPLEEKLRGVDAASDSVSS